MDTDTLSGGEHWDKRIPEEIKAADFTLVLYSPALCRKTDSYVNKEIHLASDRGDYHPWPISDSAPHCRDPRRGPHRRVERIPGYAIAVHKLRRGHGAGDQDYGP